MFKVLDKQVDARKQAAREQLADEQRWLEFVAQNEEDAAKKHEVKVKQRKDLMR